MIPLTTLYDDYIDRRKFTEEEKPFEYIVPPTKVGQNNETNKHCFSEIFKESL